MSRDTGRTRLAAKRQIPKTKGRRPLDSDSLDPLALETRAEALTISKDFHTKLLTQGESRDIQNGVEQLSREADKLREIQQQLAQGTKTRSRELDTIDEHDQIEDNTSSDHEEELEETSSRLSSRDTQPYSENSKLSPAGPYQFGIGPRLDSQAPPFVFNPQPLATSNTPAPVPTNVAATPVDPMALMQAMFTQQAESNRLMFSQQAESNRQLQLLLASSLDKQIDQQTKQMQQQANILARQSIADVRVSIKQMRDGINICQYFDHLETELKEAKIPNNKWKAILISKLSTKAEKASAHLIHSSDTTYTSLKKHLLKHIGPSIDELCNIVHGAALQEFQDKKETEKLQHAKYIAERYFLGTDQPDDTNIHHLAIRLYKFHCNKKFAHSIKLTKAQTLEELLELTSSFDSQIDYEKTKPDRSTHSYNKPLTKKITCKYCKRIGHSESECFKKQKYNRSDYVRSQSTTYKPSLKEEKYSCNNTNKKQPYKDAGVRPRPATVNWNQTTATTSSIQGLVNGHEASVIIDTGAQITVVPGKFVYDYDLTGETVSIIGVNGNPMPYQTARVPITLKGTTVVETVAVAPAHQLNTKVLLSTPINTTTTEHLLDSYLKKQQHKQQQSRESKSVNQATTFNLRNKQPVKYFPEEEESTYEDDRASDLSYNTDSETETISSPDNTDREDNQSEDEPAVKTYAPSDKYPHSPTFTSKPNHTHNPVHKLLPEPYSSNNSTLPEPYSPALSKPLTEPYSSNNHTLTEPYSPDHFKPVAEPYSPDTTTTFTSNTLTQKEASQPGDQIPFEDNQAFDIPNLPILDKGDDIQALKTSVKVDPTLKVIRGLAHHNKNGYTWENGLIYHMSLDPTLGERKRFVVPKPQRQALVEIAHDKSCHFSKAKTRTILNARFTWPNMGSDVNTHILSCIKCKEFN